MKRQKLETWQNLAGTWTAAYSSWEWETGDTEQEAIENLKKARKKETSDTKAGKPRRRFMRLSFAFDLPLDTNKRSD